MYRDIRLVKTSDPTTSVTVPSSDSAEPCYQPLSRLMLEQGCWVSFGAVILLPWTPDLRVMCLIRTTRHSPTDTLPHPRPRRPQIEGLVLDTHHNETLPYGGSHPHFLDHSFLFFKMVEWTRTYYINVNRK